MRPSFQREDAAGEAAALEILERAGELLERVAPRDELVDLETTAEVEVGEHREVAPRAGGPVAAAEDRLVLVERVDDEVEARAELRDADHRERAARAEGVQRLADDREVADRLEGVVGAAAGEVLDHGDGILAGGVDRVRRAEAAREVELRRQHVDRDDLGGAGEDPALDAAEADPAEAE